MKYTSLHTLVKKVIRERDLYYEHLYNTRLKLDKAIEGIVPIFSHYKTTNGGADLPPEILIEQGMTERDVAFVYYETNIFFKIFSNATMDWVRATLPELFE